MKKKYYKTRICKLCGDVRTVTVSSKGVMCQSCSNSSNGAKRKLDITGMRFRSLVALERVSTKSKKAYWKCKCDCGNESFVYLGHLRSGNTKSCGCLHRKLGGKSNTRTYKTYKNMMSRCYNNKCSHYKGYGGAGITVCDRWRDSYLNFLEDMGERPDGTSIDRIDPSGNYIKSNCRWATAKEQCRNRKSNRILKHKGISATVAEWSEITGIGKYTISWRILHGWSIEEALTLKVSHFAKDKKRKESC